MKKNDGHRSQVDVNSPSPARKVRQAGNDDLTKIIVKPKNKYKSEIE
jgi:hypothetical protein